MSNIQLYEALRQKLGPTEAEALVTFAEAAAREANEANMENAATKKDLEDVRSALKLEISDLRSELKLEIADLRSEVKQEIAGLRSEVTSDIAEVRLKIEETRSDMLKWVYTLFIPLLLAIIGLYFRK